MSYTISDALDVWKAWSVSGLTFYDLGEQPAVVLPAHCPLVFPVLGAVRGEGQIQRGFKIPLADNVFFVRVTGLVQVFGLGIAGAAEATAAALLDSYMAKCAADPDLNGRLSVAMRSFDLLVKSQRVQVQMYYGFEVLHRWELVVS